MVGHDEANVDDPVALVDALLTEAIETGASDLHFDPTESGGAVRLRRDGFFVPGRTLDAALYERCLGRLKLIGGVVAYRSDVPQEGRIDRDASDREATADLRLSVLPTPFGEKAVVRVFQADRQRLTVDALGFDPTVVEQLRQAAARRAGMVLVTGPCSSGKTTTLYATVRDILNARRDHAHVVSLEDPIECRLPGVTQLAVDERRGTSFAVGLEVLLRQDPNVILGEIRDAETARIAASISLQMRTSVRDIERSSGVERLSFEIAPSLRADIERASRVRLLTTSSLEFTIDGGVEPRVIVYRLAEGSIERVTTTRDGRVTRRRVDGDFVASFALSPPTPGGQPMLRLEVVHAHTGVTQLSLHRRVPGGPR